MKKQILNKKIVMILLAALFVAGSFVMPFAARNHTVKALTLDELRAQANSLQTQIDANNAEAKRLSKESDTISKKINEYDLQIQQINAQIQLTSIKLQQLDLELNKAQKELDRQKELLKASIQALYKKGGVSTVELLVGSDSFSQFINDQTYLEKLKNGIQTSAEKVIILKQQIQTQQTQQKDLLAQQESQKNSLSTIRSQQANLLATTQGEQAKYEQVLADLLVKRKRVDDELTRLIMSGSLVSMGRVHRGDIIGRIGMTGFTFGPHLHFEIRDSNNNTTNPLPNGGFDLAQGMLWPVLTEKELNQPYGCVAPYNWYYTKCSNGNSLHPGIDVGGVQGIPIVAAADGDIILRANQGDGYGNKVIIRHDNGYLTYYAHMQ